MYTLFNISLIRFVLLSIVRDKLFLSFALIIAVVASLAFFFGSTAFIEQDQFVLVFMGGALRFFAVLVMVLFIAFSVRRAFETKEIDFILASATSRLSFVFSTMMAYMVMAFVISLTIFGVLSFLFSGLFQNGFLFWGASLMIEVLMMALLAFFFAMILSSATAVVSASLGFYILSNLMGQIFGILDGLQSNITASLSIPMTVISTFIPRVDLMTQTEWLVYGMKEEALIHFFFGTGQCLVFCAVIVSASLFDLLRKEF